MPGAVLAHRPGVSVKRQKPRPESRRCNLRAVRHKPPGDYRGPEPFKPFCIGLVELPEGLRVMSPIEGDVESMQIGMRLRLRAFVHHTGDAGQHVVAFAFAPTAA